MINERPFISVLMPVFNAADFLHDAIKSILTQSFTHFELLIIDDGSTDESLEIAYQFDDSRIRIIPLDRNKGIISALNFGLSVAKGKYLARMDADDIAFPNRFEKQIDFLENNSSIGCLGTDFKWLDEPSEKSWVQYYDAENIKISLLFGCSICHPTVMFRMREIRRYNLTYPNKYPYAEDYAFWVSLSQYMKIANLTEPLLYYRRHDSQISKKKSTAQCQSIDSIQIEQIKRLGLSSISVADLMMHHVLDGAFIPFFRMEEILRAWASKLFTVNTSTRLLPDHLLKLQVNNRVNESVENNFIRLGEMSTLRRLHWQMSSTYRLVSAWNHDVCVAKFSSCL